MKENFEFIAEKFQYIGMSCGVIAIKCRCGKVLGISRDTTVTCQCGQVFKRTTLNTGDGQ